jgi:nicotinamidase-related amidase
MQDIDITGAVLLLVDFQRAFDEPPWPRKWNEHVDANATAILSAFRHADLPVLHVRHDSVAPSSTLRTGQPGNAFRPGLEPQAGEAVVSKSVNSAFIGTDLDLRLRRLEAREVFTCGISTDMCVSTTIRTGANLGWQMTCIGDACDCFDLKGADGTVLPAELVHRVHLATLAFEFCRVTATADLLHALGCATDGAMSR